MGIDHYGMSFLSKDCGCCFTLPVLEDVTMNEIFRYIGAPGPRPGRSETSLEVDKESRQACLSRRVVLSKLLWLCGDVDSVSMDS